jgi:ribosomal protein S18 acetylase RimI-like enzyme
MSEKEIIFRPMLKEEQEVVASMIKDLYKSLQAPESYMNDQKIYATFSHLSTQPENLTLEVFEQDEKIVGYALLFSFWSNEYGGMILNVDELYLKPEYRSNGISTLYFSRLITQKDKYVAMTLEVLPENEKAYALYKRIGFAKKETLFLYKLL